jgi:hypothetical protein
LQNALTDADKNDDSWQKYDVAGWYCCIDVADGHSRPPTQLQLLGQTGSGRPCISVIYPQSAVLNPSLCSSLMILLLSFIILITTTFRIPLMMSLLASTSGLKPINSH